MMFLSSFTVICCSSKRYVATDFDLVPGTSKIVFASGSSVFLGDDSDNSHDIRLAQFDSVPLSTGDGAFVYSAKDGHSIESTGVIPAVKVLSPTSSFVSQPMLSEDKNTLFYVSSSEVDRGATLQSVDAIYMIKRDKKTQPSKLIEFYSVSLSPRSLLSNRLWFIASERFDGPSRAYYYDFGQDKAIPIALPDEAFMVTCTKRGNQVAVLVGKTKPYGFEIVVLSSSLGSIKRVYQTRGYVSRIAFAEDGKSILICEDATRNSPSLLRLDLHSLKTTTMRTLEK